MDPYPRRDILTPIFSQLLHPSEIWESYSAICRERESICNYHFAFLMPTI